MFDVVSTPGPVPLQQSEALARALAGLGTPPERLEDGTLVLKRRFGPVTMRMLARPDAGCARVTRGMLDQLPGGGPVVVSPEHPLDLTLAGAVPLVSPVTVAELDLTEPRETLEAGLHPKWRNRLRHGQKQALRVSRQNMPDDPCHWLLQSDARQQSRRGYRSWPAALTLAFARENPGDAKLFSAFWGRDVIAAILILRHGTAASYHIGHTGTAGLVSSAHNLLMWEAIGWAQARGVRRLDLGIVDTEDHPGLARFKLGTGACARRLGGTWLWWPPLTPLLRPLARLDRSLMRPDWTGP